MSGFRSFSPSGEVPQKLQWRDTNKDTLLVCVPVRDQGVRADSAVSPSLRQFHASGLDPEQ